MAEYVANPWNTADQRRLAFPGTQIAYKMISRNINIPYFTGAGDEKCRNIVVGMYAKGRCLNEGWVPTTMTRPLVALEAVAPNIPDDRFANELKARTLFVRGAIRYLIDGNYVGAFSTGLEGNNPMSVIGGVNTILGRAGNNFAPNWTTVDESVRALCAINAAAVIPEASYTSDLAQALACWLHALALNPSNAAKSLSTNVYTMAYIGIAKRGMITDGKLAKVNEAVAAETSMTMNVTMDEVTIIGNSMGGIVTGQNAANIMTNLAQEMDGLSLRLRITMLQTARSGMTSFWCIREAAAVCRGFNWSDASKYIPNDFDKYNQAFIAVGNNEYYGFQADLGPAKHTNYVSLAWLAIKLLMKADAVVYGKLKDYKGLAAHPKFEENLQALIDAWAPTPGVNPVANVDMLVVSWAAGAV